MGGSSKYIFFSKRTERWPTGTLKYTQHHFSLSHIGEGNGNPLQCSCLENPRDGGAWWATIYGVTQSRTQPNRLSSSSNITNHHRNANQNLPHTCQNGYYQKNNKEQVLVGLW